MKNRPNGPGIWRMSAKILLRLSLGIGSVAIPALTAQLCARPVELPNGKIVDQPSPAEITRPHILPGQIQGLQQFKNSLQPANQTSVDLRRFQTPVKSQVGGTCFLFAFDGLIEAAYKTRCLKNRGLAASEPYCAEYINGHPPQELDISARHLFWALLTQGATHNPSANHENMSECGNWQDNVLSPSAWQNNLQLQTVMHRLQVSGSPGSYQGEKAAPYYPMYEQYWRRLQVESALPQGSFVAQMPITYDPHPYFCDSPSGVPMQQRYDNLNYDPLNISPDSLWTARYGVKSLYVLPESEVKDPANLETYLANDYTVEVGLSFSGLTCGSTLISGANKCDFNESTVSPQCTTCNSQLSSCSDRCAKHVAPQNFGQCMIECKNTHTTCVDRYHCDEPPFDPSQSFADGAGHDMLVVGYDRSSRRFILKNSWGPYNYPYLSVPYAFAKARFIKGYIIKDVIPATNANVSSEGAYLGMWHVLDTVGKYLGRMVIHRTRDTPDSLQNPPVTDGFVTWDPRLVDHRARLGTFYEFRTNNTYGPPRQVAGRFVNQQLELAMGNIVGQGGDPLNTNYNSTTFFGDMRLGDPDHGVDTNGHRYVRDFSHRASQNWLGPWALRTARNAGILTVRQVDQFPRNDSGYNASGDFSLQGGSTSPATGVIDQRGSHSHWQFRYENASCDLELYLDRKLTDGLDVISSMWSVVTCGGPKEQVWGARQPVPAPD